MTRYNKTSTAKISEILDRTTEGGSFINIGKDTQVNHATVWNILQDFPLWAYLRNKSKKDE